MMHEETIQRIATWIRTAPRRVEIRSDPSLPSSSPPTITVCLTDEHGRSSHGTGGDLEHALWRALNYAEEVQAP